MMERRSMSTKEIIDITSLRIDVKTNGNIMVFTRYRIEWNKLS